MSDAQQTKEECCGAPAGEHCSRPYGICVKAVNLCARIEHKLLCLWIGEASENEVRGLLREAVAEIDRLRTCTTLRDQIDSLMAQVNSLSTERNQVQQKRIEAERLVMRQANNIRALERQWEEALNR